MPIGFLPFGHAYYWAKRSSTWIDRSFDRSGWPPLLQTRGLLHREDQLGSSPYSNLAAIPRARWGTKEWSDYARFLEEQGLELFRDLEVTEKELEATRRKLARKVSKRSAAIATATLGLLAKAFDTAVARGRKQGSFDIEIAKRALEIKAESPKRITDLEAAKFALEEKGRGRYRASRNILNCMSRLRRSQN
jgi:hypothetical protein